MAKYEAAMIFSVEGGDDSVKALTEKFSKLIEENATAIKVDDWGKRRLAYPINDENDGYYVFTDFEAGPEFPAELERIARITEGVLRIMIIKK